MIGFACSFIGAIIFKAYLKDYEVRKLIIYGIIVSLLLSPLNFILVF